jgi:hypothetical protein
MKNPDLDRFRMSASDIAGLYARDPERARDVLVDPSYWRGIARGTAAETLGVAEPRPSTDPDGRASVGSADAAHAAHLARADILRDGYACLPAYLDRPRAAALAEGSLAVLHRRWPAPFLLMFDEPWRLARHVARAMRAAINDDLVLRYEMFVYCVDSTLPLARARGIPPHRDAPGAGFDLHGPSRLPRHGTAWLALTDTDVDNGCVYVIPAHAESEADRRRPIDEARGVPLEVAAGTLLMWDGNVAHWGGRHDAARAKGPRIALTCVASVAPTWGLPGLDLPVDVDATELPDMVTRLSFLAALLRGFGLPEPGSAVESIISRW